MTPETSTLLVEAAGLRRRYVRGGQPLDAVAGASFRIRAGDRIALAGPSGSGKSTLLHLIAGLEAPTAGHLAWPALGPAEALRPERVAIAFQAPSLLPTLTACENVALPMLLGGSAATAQPAALAALDRLGVLEVADKLPEELSGGQAQRVALARALACRPRLILADEPTGQLDGVTSQRVLDALLDGIAGTDTALVVATHDPGISQRMATVWHMDHGILEAGRA